MKLKANLKKFRPKKWMVVTAVIVIICVAVGIFFSAFRKNKAKDAMSQLSNESSVSRQSIVSSITGTAVVKPKDQYSITSLVNGDILSASFEQGDMVNEGDCFTALTHQTRKTALRAPTSPLSVRKIITARLWQTKAI